MSKEDMAAYLGITIRSLNRALKQLEDVRNKQLVFIDYNIFDFNETTL